MQSKLTDLRFVIGIFLGIVGLTVLIAGGDAMPMDGGTRVNILGGSLFVGVGIVMVISSILNPQRG